MAAAKKKPARKKPAAKPKAKRRPARKRKTKEESLTPPAPPRPKALGRPPIYGEEALDKAWDYLVNHRTKWGDNIPDVTGMAKRIGVVRETIHAWGRDEKKPEFSHILAMLRNEQENRLLQAGAINEGSASIIKLRLHKFGYYSMASVQVSGDPDRPPVGVDHTIGEKMDAATAARVYRQLMDPDGGE